ncbi:MAG: BLUF domain-containing protein [Betaproteobacteria bacterium]
MTNQVVGDLSMDRPVFVLVYVSQAIKPYLPTELSSLLSEYRINNQRMGITGMLLYKDGKFMQVLEGNESAVRELYRRIQTNPSHHQIELLFEGDQPKQQFKEWSMAFYNLDESSVNSIEGYSDYLNVSLSDELWLIDQPRLIKFITMFHLSLLPK